MNSILTKEEFIKKINKLNTVEFNIGEYRLDYNNYNPTFNNVHFYIENGENIVDLDLKNHPHLMEKLNITNKFYIAIYLIENRLDNLSEDQLYEIYLYINKLNKLKTFE